jgi:glycosyltransferase involved in cell wall biosynthesis
MSTLEEHPRTQQGRFGAPKVSVVIPCLNEASNIEECVTRALTAMASAGIPGEVVVADNGSEDGSAALAAASGARVVHEPRRGFGAACFAGLSAASAEVICFMDCDGSLDPGELPRVAEAVLTERADLVLGERRAEPGAWPAHARLANRALTLELRRRAGVRLRDLGPMRCARREPLLLLGLRDRGFGWPLEMVVRAAAAGWRIDEVTVPYRARSGRSKVTGTARGTARTVRDMLRALP